MTRNTASILTSLLAFVSILAGGDPTVVAMHALFSLVLQLRGDSGNHLVNR